MKKFKPDGDFEFEKDYIALINFGLWEESILQVFLTLLLFINKHQCEK